MAISSTPSCSVTTLLWPYILQYYLNKPLFVHVFVVIAHPQLTLWTLMLETHINGFWAPPVNNLQFIFMSYHIPMWVWHWQQCKPCAQAGNPFANLSCLLIFIPISSQATSLHSYWLRGPQVRVLVCCGKFWVAVKTVKTVLSQWLVLQHLPTHLTLSLFPVNWLVHALSFALKVYLGF